MPDGGEFTIETAHLQVGLSQPSPDGLDMDAGGYITVSISDTGVGMDQGTLEKVFEPFFTTKGVGEGTGLGLSTCWSVMNQVGGHLHMSSKPGVGEHLKVFFPCHGMGAVRVWPDQARVCSGWERNTACG